MSGRKRGSNLIPPDRRPCVEVVSPDYQLSKARLEEEIPPLNLPGGSPIEKFQHALEVLNQPANVTFLRRPKRRD